VAGRAGERRNVGGQSRAAAESPRTVILSPSISRMRARYQLLSAENLATTGVFFCHALKKIEMSFQARSETFFF
jgi:hypothetical protein